MTEYIVPMGTPQFWHANAAVTGAGYTWAGAYPYIDTADLGASYGEIDNTITGDPAAQMVGYYLPAYTAPSGVTGARVDLQILSVPGSDGSSHGAFWRLDSSGAAPWSWGSTPAALAAGVWTSVADTYTFDPAYGPSYDLPALLAALAAGTLWIRAQQAQIGVTFQISQLRLTLISTGVPPLRQVQREDGLGRSVMRARSTHSVQKSIRQRGYM